MKASAYLFIVLFASPCFAQDSNLRANVYGVIGLSALHTDESYIGSGLDAGGGLGFAITPRVEVEAEIDFVRTNRSFGSGVRFEGEALTFGGNAKFYFSTRTVRPYIFAGLGIVHFESRSSGISPGEVFESTNDSLSVQWGGGIRYFLTPRVSLRPEFRWTYNDVSFGNQLRGSVAVAYHW